MKVLWWLIEIKSKIKILEQRIISKHKANLKYLLLITLHLQTLSWTPMLMTVLKNKTTLIFLRRYKIYRKGGKFSKIIIQWFHNFLTKKLNNNSPLNKGKIGWHCLIIWTIQKKTSRWATQYWEEPKKFIMENFIINTEVQYTEESQEMESLGKFW